MSGSCPVSAHVCRETARERDELRAEVDRLRAGIKDIRDEAWEPWLNRDWQHLDTIRNDVDTSAEARIRADEARRCADAIAQGWTSHASSATIRGARKAIDICNRRAAMYERWAIILERAEARGPARAEA